MPRLTRAALRAEEESISNGPTVDSQTWEIRSPLGEISENKMSQAQVAKSAAINSGCIKDIPLTVKNGKAGRKGKKQAKATVNELPVDIYEDQARTQSSSAAEEAYRDAKSDTFEGHENILLNEESITLPISAVEEATKRLPYEYSTQYIKLRNHASEQCASTEAPQELQHTLVVETGYLKTSDGDAPSGLPINESDSGVENDSFVEQIKSRTPAKRSSRIEDSVAALDALEEEIERVGRDIPATRPSLRNAKKENIGAPVSITPKIISPSKRRANLPATTSPKATGSRSSIQPDRKEAKSLGRHMNSIRHEPVASDSGKTSNPVSVKGEPTRRVSALEKAPFQPTKSNKAPTRAAFELPGEAVARRLKEQREERQRRDEKEDDKPNNFKARPVHHSHGPEVRLTAAVKARLSLAKTLKRGAENSGPGISDTQAIPAADVASRPAVGSTKQRAGVAVPKRRIAPPDTSATQLRMKSSLNHRASINHGAVQSAPTAEVLANQKLRGKEVFSRTKVNIMEKEKARKEKEDAARNARLDAAERGRIASREWAKKQKLQKTANTKNKDDTASVSVPR